MKNYITNRLRSESVMSKLQAIMKKTQSKSGETASEV